jgi:cob(I)alamin adenosyltransferase
MKIYTRTGDQGTTSLLGGTRVAKHDLKIESYGTVDELNAWMGLLRDSASSQLGDSLLHSIQNNLFVIGSHLALEEGSTIKLPALPPNAIEELELAMDRMETELEPLKNFVLPGGNPIVSYAHLGRTVCRRAERRLAALMEDEKVDANLLIYLNRLSDFLFMASRYLTKELGAEERVWKP